MRYTGSCFDITAKLYKVHVDDRARILVAADAIVSNVLVSLLCPLLTKFY